MKTISNFKRGDTFAFIAKIADQEGVLVVGASTKFKADVKTRNSVKLSEFVITETDIPGSYLFKIADTTNWPINVLYTDIQYTDNDVISSSETVAISVEEDITS